MKFFILLIGCYSLVFSAYSYEEYRYKSNYGSGFFFNINNTDSLEERESKKGGNALKVLARHSNTSYDHLRRSWDNVVTSYHLAKSWYENGHIDQTMFDDVQQSYNFLYRYMYLNSLTDRDPLVEWVRDRNFQFQLWKEQRIGTYRLETQGQSEDVLYVKKLELDREIEEQYSKRERDIESYRRDYWEQEYHRSHPPASQKPVKGFWVLLLTILLVNAAQGSEFIASEPIERVTKPPVSEYIQNHGVPLRNNSCSSMLLKVSQ